MSATACAGDTLPGLDGDDANRAAKTVNDQAAAIRVERFHRTMADGWAYARCYASEAERRGELTGWLHYYNHHRLHTARGNLPPFSRLTNVPGQYTLHSHLIDRCSPPPCTRCRHSGTGLPLAITGRLPGVASWTVLPVHAA